MNQDDLRNKNCCRCIDLQKVLTSKDEEIDFLKNKIQYLAGILNIYKGKTQHCQRCFITTSESEDNDHNKYHNDFCNSSRNPDLEIGYQTTSDIDEVPTDNLKLSVDVEEILDGDSIISKDNTTSEDYIYDETYKMYLCVSTGYYFDKNSGLFYVPEKGAYYRYDYEKCAYELADNVSGKQGDCLCQDVTDKVCNLHLNDDSKPNSVTSDSCELPTENFAVKNEETIPEKDAENNMKTLDWDLPEGSNVTVGDLVKEIVDQHTGMSDYIYDHNSKMYYSPSTGYYFDAVRKLLYDPHSGTYYKYDEETLSYEFHSQIDVQKYAEKLKSKEIAWKREARKKYWRTNKLSSRSNCEKSVGDEENYSSPEEGELFSSDSDDDDHCLTEESMKETSNCENPYYPCIRAIVLSSNDLKANNLFLIPYPGAILGRDKSCPAEISDSSVSKIHAELKFNSEIWRYSIKDLGSRNGTFINEDRLSQAKKESESHLLSHGDIITLGSCQFLIHIHNGHETCDKCEPGLIAEKSSQEVKTILVKSKEEIEKERRAELRRLKNKYGLKGAEYINSKANLKYKDRAENRRQTVGSQCPYEKTDSMSMERSMPESNIGYKMLKKLGWKEGESLGISGQGISEPVSVRPWLGKTGLGGSEDPVAPSRPSRKAVRWVKAQQRYSQLP